jgi:HlyD family secretion protein
MRFERIDIRINARPGSNVFQSAPASASAWVRVAFAAVLLLGCGPEEVEVGPTARAERAQIERIVVATGTVEPQREVQVRPRIAGIVERIHVEEGDSVEPGQPLIEIERELLAAQVREARARLDEAEVERRFSKIAVGRSERLQGGGATSDQKRDDALARFERAKALVARGRANLDTLETQLSYATVRSPLAGRVLDVTTEEGNAVSPVTSVTGGTLLLSLSGTDALHLEGLVDENEVARVRIDHPARIRTEAFSERVFEGHVSKIAPLGKRIQNVTYFELEIEITDADAGLLRPRMSGDAEIIVETVTDALVVPETALRYRGSQIYIDTVVRSSAARLEPVDVKIGIVDGSRVQILEGLEEGTEIALQ